jgi:hypothetical protein
MKAAITLYKITLEFEIDSDNANYARKFRRKNAQKEKQTKVKKGGKLHIVIVFFFSLQIGF